MEHNNTPHCKRHKCNTSSFCRRYGETDVDSYLLRELPLAAVLKIDYFRSCSRKNFHQQKYTVVQEELVASTRLIYIHLNHWVYYGECCLFDAKPYGGIMYLKPGKYQERPKTKFPYLFERGLVKSWSIEFPLVGQTIIMETAPIKPVDFIDHRVSTITGTNYYETTNKY